MKTLKTKVHPVTVMLVLAVVGLAVYITYSRKVEIQPAPAPPSETVKQEPLPAYDPVLGADMVHAKEYRGRKIAGFHQNPAGSPLALLGCFQNDIVVTCNGNPVNGASVNQAIDELEKTGKPVVLVVYRNGKKIELKTTKLPDIAPVVELMRRQATAPQASGGRRPGR